MSASTNHWKIGLFVLLGVAIAMATLVFLGAKSMKTSTSTYITYFDESVQGLEISSPVKFRGVTIGTVSDIDVASDQRHVAVEYELGRDFLEQLGLRKNTAPDAPADPSVARRVQLASAGVTGVKFLQIDFFPIEQYPEAPLPFRTPPNYIPAAPSALKNIEDSFIKTMNTLPQLTSQLVTLMERVNGIVAEVDDTHVPQRVGNTLEKVDTLLVAANQSLKDMNTGKLGEGAGRTIANVSAATARLDRLLARVEKDDIVGSVKRTTENISTVADSATLPVEELNQTLRAVQDAANSLRQFMDALERDSDMLLKGRSKGVE
ncbi:MlaD family protein [Chondromyces apiculatus]|uniref:Paraquat-inducible protein B n=1 Tax=Chondromyces apiculatus DSM 436 TaxID=1192034 RepID=A0A017TF38_9BACT|nr:MlaD family protein [Chondromyces apiculatus]EYF07859.1 Paraquat-inducible protein B [Chondromyces apiculatus DSM 436]